MTRQRMVQRVLVAALSVSAVFLLLASGVPHDHGSSAAPHSQHACRVCKLQDGCSATPPATPGCFSLAVAVAVVRAVRALEAPRAVAFARSTPPRAPPSVS